MLGCYDFCGHYEATFQWLEERGGPALLRQYWVEAISKDSQSHAWELILGKGFAGMLEYWGHTLAEESPERGYTLNHTDDLVRIDMHDCPSKGFLIRNGLKQHADYCDHCIGWIGPLMKEAGCAIHHEHNHCGQCWWEFRRAQDAAPPSAPGELTAQDVRLLENWKAGPERLDRYRHATGAEDKEKPKYLPESTA